MRTLLLLLCLLGLSSSAQEYYYNNQKTFEENGYTYQCDVLKANRGPDIGWVTLYNKANRFTNIDQINVNTGRLISISENYEEQIDDPNVSIPPRMEKIIYDAFPTSLKQEIINLNEPLSISLYIDPTTGKIADVEFQFMTSDPFAKAPVSVFRKIEVDLKSQIQFNITAAGKKRNYVFLGWLQRFE